MRQRWRTGGATGAALALVVSACVFPTERSTELTVEMTSPATYFIGESEPLAARLVDARGAQVPNADIRFTSSDPTVAAVEPEGRLVALKVGTTTITARALAYEGAQPAVQSVQVRDRLAIDSIRPHSARFGDTLRVYGVGLDPERLRMISLESELKSAPTPILRYTPQDPQAPERSGVLTVWVAPPAGPRAALHVLSPDGVRVSPDSVVVEQHDRYYPNDTLPALLGEIGESFANPALAFEATSGDDTVGADWYRFTESGAIDRTVVVRNSAVAPGIFRVVLSDSLRWIGATREWRVANGWTVGQGTAACRGLGFSPPQRRADSTMIALRALPAGTYDLLITHDGFGGYELEVHAGYRSVLEPDVFEENDYCEVAPALPAGSSAHDLTIDNPLDIDWLRLTVDTMSTVLVAVLAEDSTALLDLYLLRDATPATLPVVQEERASGPANSLFTILAPGEYFLVVVDAAAVATPYRLVVGPGLTPAAAQAWVRRSGARAAVRSGRP